MPTRGELAAALKVFRPWLEEEAADAERAVGQGYNARTTTLPEVAELVGVARGIAQAASMVEARILALADE